MFRVNSLAKSLCAKKTHRTASPLLKDAISEAEWVAAASFVHAQTGKLESRILMKSRVFEVLPEVEGGPHVIFIFKGRYADGESNETLTVTLDQDGVWRVSGFWVKPA